MSAFPQPAHRLGRLHAVRGASRRVGLVLAAAVAAGTLGAAIGFALRDVPVPLSQAVAGGLALLALLALALARYDAVVALGMLVLGVVLVEPAPPDAVFGIAVAVAVVTGRLELRRLPLSIAALLGAFLTLNLVSAIFAFDPIVALRFFFITLYLLVFSVWLTSYVDSAGRMRLVLRTLLAGAVASAAIGSLAPFVPLPGGENLHNLGRAKAFFEDPNVFGPFLVVPALFLIDEILEPRLLRMRRMFKVAALLVLAAGILFAYSRAAWLNAAVAVLAMLAVLAMRRGGGAKATVLLATLLTTLAVLVGTLAVTGSIGFLEERARLQAYDSERFAGQALGIRIVETYPFGIGPGQFEETVEIAPHSTYVRALAEQGILGLVTVLGLLIVTLALAATNVVRGRDTFGIGSAPLLAAWCGILANSAFVDTLHWRHLWVVAALIWVGATRATGEPGGVAS